MARRPHSKHGLQPSRGFLPRGLVRRCYSTLLVVELVLFLARLIDGSALRNAVIVATPDDLGTLGKAKNTLHGFPARVSNCQDWHTLETYLILMLRPPSFFVQMLKTSSPLLTLRTKPQTSSPASLNWSPMQAMRSSSQ